MSAESALWHPFADMVAVSQSRLVIERGQGIWVWDTDGKRYLDGSASLWCANVGHGREEIASAIAAQTNELDQYNIFGDYANRPALELADRVSELAPTPGSKVFLGSGGGDMIDSAAKIARAHFQLTGQPERVHLIARDQAYHGTHGMGTSLGGIPANLTSWGPLMQDVTRVQYDSVEALEAEIERLGPDRVAAFFCEPVMGAGGVRLPPPGYIEGAAELCRRHGVLFVADCVIAGFGRLGTWLGIDRWPIEPDLITLAKGLSAGYLPIGALVAAPRVAEPFFSEQGGSAILRHGPTYAGHPVCCAAALTALDIYERENLIERGRTLEGPLHDALTGLADHPHVSEVRSGLGLLAALDLSEEVRTTTPDAVRRLQLACREVGLLVRPLGAGIAVSPPLTITPEEIALIGSGIEQALQSVSGDFARNLEA